MIYHGTVHAELKKSPKDAWNEYYSGCVDAVPRIITKPHELYIDFLPEVRKPVHNKGIIMNAGRYFAYELSKKQGRGQITVKYDPYNLNQIWAKIDDNYINVPRIAAEHKFINYEAYRINRACNQITPPGTITDPNALRQVLKNNNIVKTSKKLTRQAKVNKQKQEANMQHNSFINAGLPVTLALPPPIAEQQDIPTVSAAVNFSLPPSLFDLKD
jgi:putative transposase